MNRLGEVSQLYDNLDYSNAALDASKNEPVELEELSTTDAAAE